MFDISKRLHPSTKSGVSTERNARSRTERRRCSEPSRCTTFITAGCRKPKLNSSSRPNTTDRGSFTELVRTPASGQFSVFTAHPGVTRGGHYHHSKVEKFLVVQGVARFRFRQILTGAVHEVGASADTPVVVESIPGWAHDVTNVGEDPLVVLVWASETFDPERPDTIAMAL